MTDTCTSIKLTGNSSDIIATPFVEKVYPEINNTKEKQSVTKNLFSPLLLRVHEAGLLHCKGGN